ncbi:restriction endonuclease subunit S [Ectopseudomonas khazarica]|uniref:restriction endonuclease subunit S n=1 Tax=Ectopseudomonas khazarica TaxID=2502979 RepID=UPI003B9649DD
MSFPRYPEYKDSGVEWLGKVPSHWQVLPLKRDIAFLTSGSRGWAEHYSDEGALFLRIGNLTRDGIGLDLSDIQRVDVPEGTEGARTQVQQGDVLFSITAYLGSVAVVPAGLETAYVSQHVALARLRKDLFLPEWVAYVVSSWIGKTYLETQGYGGTKVQLSLEDVANTLVTAPPPPEQLAIATFIRYETTKLDNFMAEQEKLVALLKEKRQAVIAHAVTKGLDPVVPMKDSRVEWIGEIPNHWKVARIKDVARLESGHTPSKTVPEYWENCDIPWVSLNDSKQLAVTDYITKTVHQINELGLQNSSARMLPADSVVFTRDATIGLAAITTRPMAVSQHLVAWCPTGLMDSVYLLRVFNAMKEHLDSFTFGATIKTIGMADIKRLATPVPPISEQVEIAAFIARESAQFDALINDAQHAIDLLKERRTALISAAVTGQIDVRGLVKDEQEQAA